MITLSILGIIAAALIAFVVLTAGVLGGTFVIVFADVIVCVFIIVMIIKFLSGRKKED